MEAFCALRLYKEALALARDSSVVRSSPCTHVYITSTQMQASSRSCAFQRKHPNGRLPRPQLASIHSSAVVHACVCVYVCVCVHPGALLCAAE